MFRRRLLASAAVLPVVVGCDITVTGDDEEPELPDAAEQVDGVEVWELSVRPTAAEVGIDGDTAVFETRSPRMLELRLDGAELRLQARYLAFSAIGDTDGDPATVDLKTPTMPLEETVEVYRSALEQLGLGQDAVDRFHSAAAEATGSEGVDSERTGAHFGDLELGVVARYSPRAETGSVAVIGDWLE